VEVREKVERVIGDMELQRAVLEVMRGGEKRAEGGEVGWDEDNGVGKESRLRLLREYLGEGIEDAFWWYLDCFVFSG
jgi:hypothetical protein